MTNYNKPDCVGNCSQLCGTVLSRAKCAYLSKSTRAGKECNLETTVFLCMYPHIFGQDRPISCCREWNMLGL